MKLRDERGGVNIKAILTIAICALVVYALFKTVPHFVNHYDLDDFCKGEARFLSYGQRKEEDVKDAIFKQIRNLDIPVRREDIRIRKDGRRVWINFDYSIPVEFPGYTHVLNFSIAVDNVGV
jgi:hypothetical protein